MLYKMEVAQLVEILQVVCESFELLLLVKLPRLGGLSLLQVELTLAEV